VAELFELTGIIDPLESVEDDVEGDLPEGLNSQGIRDPLESGGSSLKGVGVDSV
jgi:hypothetical protein